MTLGNLLSLSKPYFPSLNINSLDAFKFTKSSKLEIHIKESSMIVYSNISMQEIIPIIISED